MPKVKIQLLCASLIIKINFVNSNGIKRGNACRQLENHVFYAHFHQHN